jgi:nucleoside-diphosphate-sugar epimerase
MSGRMAAVTGASGFVGSHIVDELLRDGTRVRCLLRPGSSTRWLEGKPVEIVRLELGDLARLAEAVRDVHWIVHAAGLTHARSAAEFHAVNVGGTERMLRAALDSSGSLERFLLVSSQAAAGPSVDGTPVMETDLPTPVSPYGVTKLRAEELTLLLKGRLPVVSIRPPAVYGPRDDALLKVFRLVKRHVLPMLRPGGRFTLVHAEDLARAVRLALEDPSAAGQVYFVGEPEITDYEEFGACVTRALDTWATPFRPPGLVLQAAAVAGELWGAVRGKPPLLSRQKLREITAGDWICSSTKIRTQLGWVPRIHLEEGLRGTAAWYREAGWV